MYENGGQGLTYLLKNITSKKEAEVWINRYIKNLEFLARSSARLAEI